MRFVIVLGVRAKGRVLLVEEDPLLQLAIDRQLDALGWDAVTVGTASEAIRVTEMGLIVDVLLTDLWPPDIDGRAMAWSIADLLPHVRVVFTGNRMPQEPLEPRHAPFLLKPFSTAALAAALSGAPRLGRTRW